MQLPRASIQLNIIQFTFTAMLVAILSGCGGSSSSGAAAPVVSTLNFPMKEAYQSFLQSGVTNTFTVSGTCSGTGNITTTPTTNTGSTPALAAISTFTMSLSSTGCIPSAAQTSTSYFDNTYTPVSTSGVNNNYGLFSTSPVIPLTVTVGGTGVIGAETLYASSSIGAPVTGSIAQSYIIEADTAATAIVNIISKTYNAAGSLTLTQQDRYRITNNGDTPLTGMMMPVSTDMQYAATSTNHLLLTYAAPAAVSLNTFQFQSAYQSIIRNGIANSFTVSGTCSGIGNMSSTATTVTTTATTTTPSITPAFYAYTTLTLALNSAVGCTPSSAQTSISYYDNSYLPLGMNGVNNNYGVFTTSVALPVSVKVGATGILGTENLFSISNGSAAGTLSQSYIIEPDTSTTALVNIISKTYNASNSLTLTEQDLYRISPDPANSNNSIITPVSADLQYTYNTISHLIFTYP